MTPPSPKADTMTTGMTMTVHFSRNQVEFTKAIITRYRKALPEGDAVLEFGLTNNDLRRELDSIIDRLDGKP